MANTGTEIFSTIPKTAGAARKVVFNAGLESSLEYAEPSSVITPEIKLLFSPFSLPFIPIEILGTNANKIISKIEWTKDRNNPGGVLQCTITPDSYIIEDIVEALNKVSGNLYSTIWGELGVDLEDLFKPMTLCQLWIDDYHVMTGTVRSCQRSASIENKNKSVSYTIIIEELGNMYNISTLSNDVILKDGLQLQVVDAISKALSMTAKLKGASIYEGINSILNAFKLTNLTQGWSLSDGFPLPYRLLSTPSPYGGIALNSLAQFMTVDSNMYQLQNQGGGNQSVWSFLKSFIPNPWMEFFTESGGRTMVTSGGIVPSPPSVLFPGFNYVVSRTTPYSNPLIGTVNPAYISNTLLFDLTAIHMLIGGDFVIITDDTINDKTLGFDSINQSTVFHTAYTNGGSVQAPDLRDKSIKTVGPLNPFASGGISTFGSREMYQTIEATSLIGLGTGVSTAARIKQNIIGVPGEVLSKRHFDNLLATWFRNQSRFREGTVVSKLMPYARAGMYCLYLPSLSGKKAENMRDIGIYYIDSLMHNYSVENDSINASTTLNLIRGVPLPLSVAQHAMLLFDFEVLPPVAGLGDGEYAVLSALRKASSRI